MADFDIIKDNQHYSTPLCLLGCKEKSYRALVEKTKLVADKLKTTGFDFKRNVESSINERNPSLDATIKNLLEEFFSFRFFILPNGELESCMEELISHSGNKNAWLNSALALMADKSSYEKLEKTEIAKRIKTLFEKLQEQECQIQA